MKYKAIIFDVGDTLLEHYPSTAQIYAERLKYLNLVTDDLLNVISASIARASNGQIIKEQNGEARMSDEDFNIMLDKAALSCVKNLENEDYYLEKLRALPLIEQELRIIPGTVEVLRSLKEKGFRLGIVSNHRTWLPEYLRECGLAEFFETIIVSDIVGAEKPDIRIMQIALEKLGLDAASCLYVGDHPFDVLCARSAGMDCAWIAPADAVLPDSVPYGETYRIKKLGGLLPVLDA